MYVVSINAVLLKRIRLNRHIEVTHREREITRNSQCYGLINNTVVNLCDV